MYLAIESSCDESALALLDPQRGIVAEYVRSQAQVHRAYGGVVPDLASKAHLEGLEGLTTRALAKLEGKSPTCVMVTQGPGLAGCLAVGIACAKALAFGFQVPLWGINHLKGHAFSVFLKLHEVCPKQFRETLKAQLPHLGLIVSGGHTLLFKIEENLKITGLAQSVDDAVGEALDKGARLLGLSYPGGPLIEQEALSGDPQAFDFPKSIQRNWDKRFSFSGLKTSLRYRLEKMDEKNLADLAASYQEAAFAQLFSKTKHALEKESFKSLGLSGGVAQNKRLRELWIGLAEEKKLPLFIPNPQTLRRQRQHDCLRGVAGRLSGSQRRPESGNASHLATLC